MSPVLRYIVGYVLRFIFGTALVLFAIAAVRITKFDSKFDKPQLPANGESQSWESLLVYPDKIVDYTLHKYAPQFLPVSQPASDNMHQDSLVSAQTNMCPLPGADSYSKDPHPPAVANNNETPMPSFDDETPPEPAVVEPVKPVVDIPYSGEWGLTTDPATPVYSLRGKKMGTVQAGNIFVVLERKRTSKGEFLKCAFLRRTEKPIILKPKDTILYKCDINATSDSQRKLCVRQARLLGAIAARENKLKEKSLSKNPYAADYKKIRSEYREMAEKSNSYLKQYNDTSGAERMKAADQLRLIKPEVEAAKHRYSAVKKKYKSWKTSHAVGSYSFSQDSKIKQLRQELAEVERKLSNP
jgi:hypothetical protein